MNGCHAGRMANFVAMWLEKDGRLTRPTQKLLGAVSGVRAPLLASVRVFPKDHNWLHFPWYAAAKGGGAFVMGERISAHRHFFLPEHSPGFLFLLAHEVGHLPHAERFGASGLGRSRFVCWAAGHYLRSALLHGKHAHRLARIEQEAERGRWVLRELVQATQKDSVFAHMQDEAALSEWLQRHTALIASLHKAYKGW